MHRLTKRTRLCSYRLGGNYRGTSVYLRAYGRIYRDDGAMTPGSTPETVDAMSLEKIDVIIDALRHER